MINPIVAQYIAEIRHTELIAEADRNRRAGRRRRRRSEAGNIAEPRSRRLARVRYRRTDVIAGPT